MNQLLPILTTGDSGNRTTRGRIVHANIIAAGYRLFVERGFAAVTMEQIAEAAGVSRRTLYYKFKDKDEIFCRAFEPVIDELSAAVLVDASGLDDPVAVIERYAKATAALMANPRLHQVLRVLVHDSDTHPWLSQVFVARVRIPARESFKDAIRQLKARGALRGITEEAACEQFFGQMMGSIVVPRLLHFERDNDMNESTSIAYSAVRSLMQSWIAGS